MASHAWAVFVGQIAVMGFGVVDTIVAGRHSEFSLAALSIGSAVFITVHVSLMGLLTALLPIWAELHGARRLDRIGPSVRQSLYVCAGASVVGMAVLLHPAPILRWTQVPEELRPIATEYLAVVGWSLPAGLLFRAFSTLSQALDKPQLVSWLQVTALAVKLPLSVWLTFGGAGMPELGVVGCAWATFVVNFLLCALALGLIRRQAFYRSLDLWRRLERPDPVTLLAFARLGVPAALTIAVEITSFTLMALFIARLGSTAAAAHQIAANLTGLLYMVPLSLAVAASARVGWWRGAGDEARARRVALQACWIAAALGCALAALLFASRPWLAAIYTTNATVALLATRLLSWLALMHMADALQTVAIFLLRCWRVTLAPFLVYGVVLWGEGLAGGYLLAYRGLGPLAPWQSPVAFWCAAAGALWVVALTVQWMLRRVSARALARRAALAPGAASAA
jgi:MATE family multidrug resistance protein